MVETSKGLASLGYLGLTLGVAAIGAEALVVSPLLDDMAHEFGTVPGDLGTAVASYGFAVALSAPLLSYGGWSMAGWGGFSAICVGAAVGNGLASLLLATERTALAGRPAQHAKD
jgi:predicted MFS family arabinose efflux permease